MDRELKANLSPWTRFMSDVTEKPEEKEGIGQSKSPKWWPIKRVD